jgi:hypothetical protein
LARLLGRAREGGGVIDPGPCRGGSASPSWPTEAREWARRWWRRAAEPTANGACRFDRRRVRAGRVAPAFFTRIISLRCTVAAARASDRGVSRCLGVRAQAGYGGANMACPSATSCVGARFCKVSLTYPFCTRILSRFQNRSGPNFEYQSCPTSYHLQKGHRI